MQKLIIQKLAVLADEQDKLGNHIAADLLDQAINAIIKSAGQPVGKPEQDPSTGKWYQKYYDSSGINKVEVGGPEGGPALVQEETEPSYYEQGQNYINKLIRPQAG